MTTTRTIASFIPSNEVLWGSAAALAIKFTGSILGFAMFAILWRLRDHKHAEGWLFGVWCILAGVERFVVEFFRAKDDRFSFLAGLSTAQVIALAIALAGVAIMAARRTTGPDRPSVRSLGAA